MKKLMSIAFAAALAFGSLCMPVNAQETNVVNEATSNPSNKDVWFAIIRTLFPAFS